MKLTKWILVIISWIIFWATMREITGHIFTTKEIIIVAIVANAPSIIQNAFEKFK